MARLEPRLRRALVALCGVEAARDATAEALAYAWQHWDRIAAMRNPAGYVYRGPASLLSGRSLPGSFSFGRVNGEE